MENFFQIVQQLQIGLHSSLVLRINVADGLEFRCYVNGSDTITKVQNHNNYFLAKERIFKVPLKSNFSIQTSF